MRQRMRGDRASRRGTGADRRRLRRAEATRSPRHGDRNAAAKPRSGDNCALQISARSAVRGGLAENADGQDPTLPVTVSLLIDDRFQGRRCAASSLIDLALREAGCAGVALDDRLALSVAQDTLDGFKACRGEFLDFVDHPLWSALAIEA